MDLGKFDLSMCNTEGYSTYIPNTFDSIVLYVCIATVVILFLWMLKEMFFPAERGKKNHIKYKILEPEARKE